MYELQASVLIVIVYTQCFQEYDTNDVLKKDARIIGS